MPLSARCPECAAPFAVTPALKGKKVRCKKCRHIFVVGAPTADPDEEDEDRPAARRSPSRKATPSRQPRDDEDDEDERPRRKKAGKKAGMSAALLFGLIGGGALVVLTGLLFAGFALGWFSPARPSEGPNNNPIAQNPDRDGQTRDGPPQPSNSNPMPMPNPVPAGPLQAAAVKMELKCIAMSFRQAVLAPEAKVLGVYNWLIPNKDTRRHLFHRYDVVTGKHLSEIEPQGFTDNSDVLSLSPDGKLLAAIQHKAIGHTVWVWNAATGEVIIGNDWQPFPRGPGMNLGHPDTTLTWIQFLDTNRLLALSSSGVLGIFTVPQRQQVGVTRLLPANSSAKCNYGTKMPQNFAVSPNRTTLAMFNGDGFNLVDLTSGQVTRTTASFGEKQPLRNAAPVATTFSPDGGKLICLYTPPSRTPGVIGLSNDDAIIGWDLKSAEKTCPKLFGFDIVRNGRIGPVGPTQNGDNLFTPGPLIWWGDRHLVLTDPNLYQGHLIDLGEARYTVCLLGVRTGGRLCPQPLDGRLWYAASPGINAMGVLVGLDAPAPTITGQRPRNTNELAGQAYLDIDGIWQNVRR